MVVVAFDNEEHGDPKLLSFRPNPKDRFESEVWARVGAIRLSREGFDVRVGHLPDEWRNEKGKADWDSALAGMLRAGKAKEEIQKLFLNVLQQAIRISELAKSKLFDAATERIIGDRVDLLTYEPALPWGGHSEQKLAKELRRLAAGKLSDWAGRILLLAEAYEKTRGWYYELKISEQRYEKLLSELKEAEGAEQILFLKLALKGSPSLVAPIRVIPLYVLVKPDGSRARMVKLNNIRGEWSPVVALDENSMTAARDWRRWLARQGNYGWEKGDGPLHALQRDVNFMLARCEVVQLVCYGCEGPGKPWFLNDCAYVEGRLIIPDAEGVFAV